MRVAACLLLGLSSIASRALAEPALFALDGEDKVVAAPLVRASLQRTPPRPLDDHARDPDALRFLLGFPADFALASDTAPGALTVTSRSEGGRQLDKLERLALSRTPCPAALPAAACAVTVPVRAVADTVDRDHPLVRARSIVAELGGTLAIEHDGRELGRVIVTGPRHSAIGAIERMRAKLRFVMVRLSPGGALPVGGHREGAVRVARAALARANALWSSCGVSFGAPEEALVEIVDPPPAHLLAVGCAHGLPASGGIVSLSLRGRPVRIAVDRGMLPRQAARRLAAAIERAGFSARISDNPRMSAGAHPTSDVSVTTARGELVDLAPSNGGPISSDATLGVCLGSVDLEDGLQHFGDVDAVVGTIEERTLIKAYDDLDPRTVDVVLVPGFARGGRIGESFIFSDRGSITNTVLLDRAGARSNRASFTLAHELGHVLLDDPGHPDDFALDTPTSLMDADASDPTAFGPRRLSIEECSRAIRQSGPAAPVQLLAPWPIGGDKN
jgi:hypothetical protein